MVIASARRVDHPGDMVKKGPRRLGRYRTRLRRTGHDRMDTPGWREAENLALEALLAAVQLAQITMG